MNIAPMLLAKGSVWKEPSIMVWSWDCVILSWKQGWLPLFILLCRNENLLFVFFQTILESVSIQSPKKKDKPVGLSTFSLRIETISAIEWFVVN